MIKSSIYAENDKPIKITGRNMILCEGKDAKLFILHFLGSTKYANLVDLKDGIRDIEVRDFGGNSQLPTHLMILKSMDGFENVKSILIIRDAETNYENAINEIKSALKNNSLPVPNNACEKAKDKETISIGFLLFPTCSKKLLNGTLEDLCIKIIAETNKHGARVIAEEYLNSMKKDGYTELKQYHKNILYSYLSAKDKFVTKKLGEAARDGAFDFKSEELNSLLEFIGEMINE